MNKVMVKCVSFINDVLNLSGRVKTCYKTARLKRRRSNTTNID